MSERYAGRGGIIAQEQTIWGTTLSTVQTDKFGKVKGVLHFPVKPGDYVSVIHGESPYTGNSYIGFQEITCLKCLERGES